MAAHLYVAHLPYALILVGAGLDALGVATASEPRRRWAGHLLILGASLALAAFATGQAAVPYSLARPQANAAAIEAHSLWGGTGVWLLAIAGGLRAAWRHHLHGARGWANLALGVGSGLLIVAITRSGLAIAHGG